MVHVVTLTPGTPTKLDDECPACGWADIWEVAILSLSPNGVCTVAIARRCLRCNAAENPAP